MTATRKSTDDESAEKDLSFRKVAALAEEMIAAHGMDFTMGAFILAARFIAQDKPFTKDGMAEEMSQ